MKNNYNLFTPLSRIATSAARNDVWQVNDRHCEDDRKRGCGNPGQGSECETHPRHCERRKTRGNPVQKGARGGIKAFSLIELLISLIVISLIISSFIPIITKKLKYQNSTLAAGIVNCKKFDEKCVLCDKKECTLCSTQLNLIDGQYVDPKAGCKIRNCPDNCAKCDATGCKQCKEDYSLIKGQCINLCLKIGNICVQRFNAGDDKGLEIPDGLVERINPVDTNYVDYAVNESPRAICWSGQTSKDGQCSAFGDYPGCNRTVCTWYAATKICAHYGLRLPTYLEAQKFINYAKDLQLCDNNINANLPQCAQTTRCPYGHENLCRPNGLWCSRKDGKKSPPNYDGNPIRNGGPSYNLSGSWGYFGSLGEDNCNPQAYSVRCVKDL